MTLNRLIVVAGSALGFAALFAAAPDSFARGGVGGGGAGGGSRPGADGSGADPADTAPLGGTGTGSGKGATCGIDFGSAGDEQKEILRDVLARYAHATFREFRGARNERTAEPIARR